MTTPDDVLLVLSTFPDDAKAREVARVLVGEGLAACANLLPGATSLYVWEGRTEEVTEVLAVFKTARATYPELETRLRGLHPYELPEIVALPVAAGLPAYLDWVTAGSGGGGGERGGIIV